MLTISGIVEDIKHFKWRTCLHFLLNNKIMQNRLQTTCELEHQKLRLSLKNNILFTHFNFNLKNYGIY